AEVQDEAGEAPLAQLALELEALDPPALADGTRGRSRRQSEDAAAAGQAALAVGHRRGCVAGTAETTEGQLEAGLDPNLALVAERGPGRIDQPEGARLDPALESNPRDDPHAQASPAVEIVAVPPGDPILAHPPA